MDINWEEHHETTSDCIRARRHLGDGHGCHADTGARLAGGLGLGPRWLGAGLVHWCRAIASGLRLWLWLPCLLYGYGYPAYSYGYGYPAYSYASYGYGYPAYSYGYGGGYYRPIYRSAYSYGGYRPRPAVYGGYRVARRVAIHRAR